MRSFRSALALRVTVQALVLAIVLLVGATFLLRTNLLSSVDASLLQSAQVQAAVGVGAPGGEFRFPALLAPRGSEAAAAFPWAQALTPEGRAVARSANLQGTLPVPVKGLDDARRGAIGRATLRWNGQDIRAVLYPLSSSGQAHPDQVLEVAVSLEPLRLTLVWFAKRMAVVGLVCTILAWLLARQIAGRALEPALAITSQAESIGVNELGRRVTAPGSLIEFNRMAVAFNALLERIERAVTGTRRFTSDASHELRAPLTVLRGELELALSRPRTLPDYEEVLRRCLDEVLRLARLADDLLTLTRVEGGVVGVKRVPVDLDEMAARAVGRKTALATGRGVTLELSGTAGMVSGDGDLLLRAVECLLEHAIMASPRGGTVRILLSDRDRRCIEVTDSGPGLKQDEISGVFQRFYRSNRPRSASEESGLGLPIARAVALSHGGVLDYAGNHPGASFRMLLPSL
ncbi:MAG TPA: ATP-binding protein [Gemmatimonadales bacterium]|nr:ATP-binding protein [Gemmatimonadales bacterium]